MKLSIVTPSYNQGKFIQATIDSVLSQNFPDLEYLVMDGGSNDQTVALLKTYGNAVQWVSEPDGGQAAGVNKGILRATGDIIGWINSDDVYYPGAFEAVMDVFEKHPEVNVLYGHADHLNEDGSYKEDYYTEEWNYERLKDVCYICQPAVFFRRSTVIKYGLLNANRQFAMDYDLWLRMGKTEKFYYLHKKLAGSRFYSDNKTLGSYEKVHFDIMDTCKEVLGEVPDKWLEGTSNLFTRKAGFSLENPGKAREYCNHLVFELHKLLKLYRGKMPDSINELPYSSKLLRIGLDVSRTQSAMAGCAYYRDQLAKALSTIDNKSSYILYTQFPGSYSLEKDYQGTTIDNANFINLHKGREKLVFESRNMEGKDNQCLANWSYPNVIHCSSFSFPLNLTKQVATAFTIFDCSFLEHPEYTTEANRCFCFDGMFQASLHADVFLSISQYSKDVFLKYFPHVNPETIHVTPLGFRPTFLNKPKDDKELQELGVTVGQKFWLNVGTVEPRKNLISLVRAYAELKKQGKTFPLYIAGGKGWLDNEIYTEVKARKLEKEIIFLGYVTDEQLNALYHACYAMVYPSLYEGFGLPILEAMAAGAPVITSNTTSMPEVGGDAVLYVDPRDINSIVIQMQLLQNDEVLRNDLSIKGKERAVNNFSWESTAEKTFKCYYEAVWRHEEKRLFMEKRENIKK